MRCVALVKNVRFSSVGSKSINPNRFAEPKLSMPETGAYNPDTLDLPSGCFIGGKLVPGDGTEYDVNRPSDGHVARRERGASSALVDRAVSEAARAFKTSGWATGEPRARGRILRK